MTDPGLGGGSLAPSSSGAWYVYAVVPAHTPTADIPSGIDGEPVTMMRGGRVAALVSTLDPAAYGKATIEARVGEVEWIAPRAQAHDMVVTWASQPGPVVPLHMWTLFADRDSLEAMLSRREGELHAMLERVRDTDEFGVRVFADSAVVLAKIGQSNQGIADAERAVATASAGQRYLLERKLEQDRKAAARAHALQFADAVQNELSAHAASNARDVIPATGTADAAAILSAAFLVRRDRLEAFRRTLTRLVREHEADGFRFEFTGPWPPYHFVGGSESVAQDGAVSG